MVQIIPNRKRNLANDLLQGVGGALQGILGAEEMTRNRNIEDQQRARQQLLQQREDEQFIGRGEFLRENFGEGSQYLSDNLAKEMMQGLGKNQAAYQKSLQSESILRDLEKRRGLEPGSLDAYGDDISLAERITKPDKLTQSQQPINPDQLNIIKKIRNTEDYQEASPSEKYNMLTEAGVSRENAKSEADLAVEEEKNRAKERKERYAYNQKFIDATTSKYKAFSQETKPRLMQMQSLATNEDLMSPSAAKFAQSVGLPISILSNPSSELYDKLSNDLLKGLPETFGNRILKVEVENFLKTLPSLLNSPQGRRMVSSNILKLGEMKELEYNEMRRLQKKYDDLGQPLPYDFQQKIMDNIEPSMEKLRNEFVSLSNITEVPQGTTPFFSPTGEIRFVPNDRVEWAMTQPGAKRIW